MEAVFSCVFFPVPEINGLCGVLEVCVLVCTRACVCVERVLLNGCASEAFIRCHSQM